jgi:tetratricopeptide repeat protein 21B
MSEALSLFTGTSEEARVTVADCDLAVAAGDVEGALQVGLVA